MDSVVALPGCPFDSSDGCGVCVLILHVSYGMLPYKLENWTLLRSISCIPLWAIAFDAIQLEILIG